jgi:hypothetical protein
VVEDAAPADFFSTPQHPRSKTFLARHMRTA